MLSCTEEGMRVGVGDFVWILNVFYYPFHVYIYFMKLFWETLLPSLGLIKHVHDVIYVSYHKHWIDKWKYIPYIYVTHKVFKSCKSKMATSAHDVCDVQKASSLYIKTCWQSLLYMYMYNTYV